jgi:hypothetical protein
MLSCLLGCAPPHSSCVEVPRPRMRGATAPVGVQPQPPALLRLHRRANSAVQPSRRPKGCAEEEDEAGYRTHSLSLSLRSHFVLQATDFMEPSLKRGHCSLSDGLLGRSVQAGPNNTALSLLVMLVV